MKHLLSIITLMALVLLSLTSVSARADESKNVLVRAQGNAYHSNFVSAANKRGDLRLNIATQDIDAAFTRWLKSEHPDAYRQAASRTSVAGNKADNTIRTAASYCCDKDGRCCKGNCSQCCAKGSCTMGCCTMDACKKMRLACCK